MINTLIIAPCTIRLSRFLDRFFPSYCPPSVAIVAVAPFIYTRSPPPFLAQNAIHMDVAHTHPPPAFAARSAPRSACLCLTLYPASFAPFPLLPSACVQVAVGPWGLPDRNLCLPCVLPPSLCAAPLPVIFWVLASMGVHFA